MTRSFRLLRSGGPSKRSIQHRGNNYGHALMHPATRCRDLFLALSCHHPGRRWTQPVVPIRSLSWPLGAHGGHKGPRRPGGQPYSGRYDNRKYRALAVLVGTFRFAQRRRGKFASLLNERDDQALTWPGGFSVSLHRFNESNQVDRDRSSFCSRDQFRSLRGVALSQAAQSRSYEGERVMGRSLTAHVPMALR
jgi:hypothetical protein